MSEPLSSTEIEDVLSSIRRLVSDDLRPLHRSAPAVVPNEKLILTPALRVVQDDVAASPPPAPNRLHLGLPAQAEPAGLDQIVAAVGAAVDADPSEWEAETGDAAPIADQTWPSTEPSAPFFDDSGAIEDDEADVFAAAEPDWDDDTFVATPDTPMAGWEQAKADPVHDFTARGDAPAALQGILAPDPAWVDAAEASVIASLAQDDQDMDADRDATEYDDPQMQFEEEVLRELVRDILREELAGRMGERITRNIRKLVRAEIARSFATQEFE